MEDVPVPSSMSISFDWSKGGRNHMEDRTTLRVDRDAEGKLTNVILCVLDGHGGDSAADSAATILPQQISEQLGKTGSSADAIRNAFHKTNELMFAELDSWPPYSPGVPSGSGTTATTVLIRGDEVTVANCGDSTAILGVRSGDVSSGDWYPVGVRATVAHTVTGEERRRILKSGGMVSAMRGRGVARVVWEPCRHHCWARRVVCSHLKAHRPLLNMTRALGDFWSFSSATGRCVVICDPHVATYSIDKDSIFGVCLHTDGVVLKPWRIASILSGQEIGEHEKENFAGDTSLSEPCLATNILRESEKKASRFPEDWDNATAVTINFNCSAGVLHEDGSTPVRGQTVHIL